MNDVISLFSLKHRCDIILRVSFSLGSSEKASRARDDCTQYYSHSMSNNLLVPCFFLLTSAETIYLSPLLIDVACFYECRPIHSSKQTSTAASKN